MGLVPLKRTGRGSKPRQLNENDRTLLKKQQEKADYHRRNKKKWNEQ